MEIVSVLWEEKKAEFTCALCSTCFLAAQPWHGNLEGSGALSALAHWKPAKNVSLKRMNEKEWAFTRWLLNGFQLGG